ncbi:MAG TPA: hypothetical protein ENI42_06310 [Thermoplasmatales archaeon]|nr:hypothetical protein [Thermoplasmatales archaeon]
MIKGRITKTAAALILILILSTTIPPANAENITEKTIKETNETMKLCYIKVEFYGKTTDFWLEIPGVYPYIFASSRDPGTNGIVAEITMVCLNGTTMQYTCTNSIRLHILGFIGWNTLSPILDLDGGIISGVALLTISKLN